MTEDEFVKLLKKSQADLDRMLKSMKGGLTFEYIDTKELTLGQQEILDRIRVEEDNYCDQLDPCGACRDMWLGDIDRSKSTIDQYISGRLNNPTKTLVCSYIKSDRSTSQTIFVIIKNSRPVVVSFKNDLSSAIQNEIKNQKVDDLKKLKLPKTVLIYQLMPEKSYRVAFTEELAVNIN